MRKFDTKNHQRWYNSRYVYYLSLGVPLFIYASIIIFQILRLMGVQYDIILWNFYIDVLFYQHLFTLKIQVVYYIYTGIYLNNYIYIFILNFFYWPISIVCILILKILLVLCYFFKLYLITIDLLLDLTRFFIFYLDNDLDEFVRKHPVFDSKTEFLVDKRLIWLMNYLNNVVPNYYMYIPSLLVNKYDLFCSIIWRYFKINYPVIALVYTAISFFYFTFLVMLNWITLQLQIISENYFSLLIFIPGIMDDILQWCYPWLNRYDFVSSFSIPIYMEFLHTHRHPRGVNIIIFLIISNFLDKAFNTLILLSVFNFFLNLFKNLNNVWLYLKNRKLLLFVFVLVVLGLPLLTYSGNPEIPKPTEWHK